MDSNFKAKESFLFNFWIRINRSIGFKLFKKNQASNYFVWDDKSKKARSFKSKRTYNLNKTLQLVDFVVLSPELVF